MTNVDLFRASPSKRPFPFGVVTSVLDVQPLLRREVGGQISHVGVREVRHLPGHDGILALAGFVVLQRVIEIVAMLARERGEGRHGADADGTVTAGAGDGFGLVGFVVALGGVRQGRDAQCDGG